MVTTSLLGSIRAVDKIKLSSLHFGSTWLIYLYLFICLSIWKHANSSTISLLFIDWKLSNMSSREQSESTSTRPFNHISEIKLYNKIIYNSIIYKTNCLSVIVVCIVIMWWQRKIQCSIKNEWYVHKKITDKSLSSVSRTETIDKLATTCSTATKKHGAWEWRLSCINHKCPESEHSYIASEKDFAALVKRKKTYCYTQLIYYQELMHDCY